MAVTSFATGDALAVKLWSKKVAVEALKQTWVFKFMGKDDSSVIQIFDDTQKGPGDRIRIPLRRLLSGDGVAGDATLEGLEERISYFNDDVFISQLRHAVREGGRFSRQLVPFDVREHARLSLQDWWADRIDTWFFNQITGNSGQTDLRYTGNQTAVAADADHLIIAGGHTGFSLSSTTTNKFTLTLVDVAVEKAKTLAVPIRPVMVGGEQKYVLFLHHHQVTDLRNNTDTGQWFDIQKAALQGGNITKNPIYTGALAEYNGVVMHATNRIPGLSSSAGGVTGTPVRHAVMCGAQAAVMAFGRGHSPERYEWVEDYFDYENQFGVAAGCISGLKKTRFDGSDFATIAIRTWAESHSTN